MLKVFLASLALILPLANTADLKAIYFRETFLCSTGRQNIVRARMCEWDGFTSHDCSPYVQEDCGAKCTILLSYSDSEDEWPGDEFEFYVEWTHTCKPDSASNFFQFPFEGFISIPIAGPPSRTFNHTYNLDTYE